MRMIQMKNKILIILAFTFTPLVLLQADENKKITNTAHQAGRNLEKQTVGGLKNRSTFSRQYGMAGCGLGSMAMGNKDGQILAATTNGTSFNQMFGITFGTLNCVGTPIHAKADQIDRFILVNRIAFTDDVAREEGETIPVIAHLMGCPEETDLAPLLHRNFSQIFSSPTLVTNEVTDHLITVVGQDSELSTRCGIQI